MGKNSNQRADRFNPNNPAFKAAADHNANIHNPTSSEFKAAAANKEVQHSTSGLSESVEPGSKPIQTKP